MIMNFQFMQYSRLEHDHLFSHRYFMTFHCVFSELTMHSESFAGI